MDCWNLLLQRLPRPLCEALEALDDVDKQNLEEIRLYRDARAEWVICGAVRRIPVQADMQELLACLSAHALYSCEHQMAEGFIPLPGGHRAGICGRMVRQTDGAWRMTEISSVCIRIARHIGDASLPIRPYLLDEAGRAQRVLILGAPGSGKTTVLRDAALWLSRKGLHVAVADEREELFAGQTSRLNVLSGMDKAHAFPLLLRAMAPQVMVSDEIGRAEDVQAVLDCVRCGVGLLLSAHAGSMEEAACRPVIRDLMAERAFDWYISLGRRARVTGVYDCAGRRLEEKKHGQLGCGRDGDDCRERGGVSGFGW